MNKEDIAGIIDQSLLRPDATVDDLRRVCDEAIQYGFFSVCINPYYVPFAKEMLSESPVRITTVIGFPHGITLTRVKAYEAIESLLSGADELDIVMNIGMAKSSRWDMVRKDISDVIAATKGAVHKIIIETCFLSREEKIKASEIVLSTGAEFIKTSTGYGSAGATVDDIKLIKSVVKDACGIKASGGIKTLTQVREMISAGANRIGTSSGVEIVTSHSGILLNK